ncbi:trypsin CFT-1-like [Maniola jurtina]|uniref:trypsin CFT-1-like n=1 Tax=Maniola jurtina TaxID=191418 RepID=UPI001E6890D8|nr:trypsin CFT-1-like [Maniola jurtina]
MHKIAFLLAICLTSAVALPQQRIAGGSLATVAQHPYAAVFLYARDNVNYLYECGGTIINNRSVLTAALCWGFRPAHQIRIRVGSSYANSGGSIHGVRQLIEHPNLDDRTEDSNIGIVRVATAFSFGNNVRAGLIAGSNYIVLENQAVWAIGWGQKGEGEQLSEQLRQVQIRKVSQSVCRSYHVSRYISPNMLCAGWEGGGRGSCWGDHGSPLLHNDIVVGITSFGTGCGGSGYPSIYTKVSRFTSWISSNA